jgi:hypothetical protein
MGYTFGGSAPAYILAVYPCSDSPTVYSVPVGVALSLPYLNLRFIGTKGSTAMPNPVIYLSHNTGKAKNI